MVCYLLCMCTCLTVDMGICVLQEILKNLESHKQTFQQIHRERSVNGVPVPPEHLQDMAERSVLLQSTLSQCLH